MVYVRGDINFPPLLILIRLRLFCLIFFISWLLIKATQKKKKKKKRMKIVVFLQFFVSVREVRINNRGALLVSLPKSIYDHILHFSVVFFNDCDKYLLIEHLTMQGQRVNKTQPFPYLIS